LMGVALKRQSSKIASVRLDAFKYSATSLRRHVLEETATQLLGKDKGAKFAQDLYGTRTEKVVDFGSIRRSNLLPLLLWVGVSVITVALILGTVGAAFSAVAQPNTERFWIRLLASLPSGLQTAFVATAVPASILGALVGIAGATLPVTFTRPEPTTDEQFEREFKILLDRGPAEKVVIFVDELDRCSPSLVVDVLDTIRTFLDVGKSIFIVAADQQILQEALTDHLKKKFA